MQSIFPTDWGEIEYGEAWERQEAMLAAALYIKRQAADRKATMGASPELQSPESGIRNELIFCQHPHVYTLGKSGQPQNLLLSDERMKAIDATFYRTNRGGDITYHGPGQIVGYPLFDLEQFRTDLGWYMRSLEEVIIKTISHYGIQGERLKGATGVWLDADDPAKARKICAMGVRCSRWMTMHGFALNVNTDLAYFGHIIPCGLVDKGVTSMAAETGCAIDEQEVKVQLLEAFAAVFDADILPEESRIFLTAKA